MIGRELAAELSRREFVTRAGALGAGAIVAAALPTAAKALIPDPMKLPGELLDPTLAAFFDTVIPGRRARFTDLGNPIHPRSIAGVDPEPGAVEADAVALSHNPKIGFDTIAPAFLAELEALAALEGRPFLFLPYRARKRVAVRGLMFTNPTRVLWEAAAAVPFTAFCAAATQVNATDESASGYAVMGHPGTAPNGYPDFSYRRRLANERTARGNLP